MSDLPLDDARHDELVSCAIDGDDECPLTGVVHAFRALGTDVQSLDTSLADWVDIEAVESFLQRTGPEAFVYARIWGHPVVVTDQVVTVYADEGT